MTRLPSQPGSPDACDHATDPVRARKKAMDYLARREHGGHELRAKLEAVGFASDVAATAVEQLAREGLQDDRRFVENFLRSRIDQGKGPVRIRLELRQHSLDGPLVDDCLQAVNEDWAGLARRIRERKFGVSQPGDFREKARQMRFLQYRGFETEHIKQALNAPDGD